MKTTKAVLAFAARSTSIVGAVSVGARVAPVASGGMFSRGGHS